jgi:DNA repair protein RadC
MKDLAVPDRPREKLARAGPASLGDNELVALIVSSGTRERDALTVAAGVLQAAGGTAMLAATSLDALCRVPGVGHARAARLIAAVELGRRVLVRKGEERRRFRRPSEVAHYLMALYGASRLERFGVMLLDARQRLIRSVLISVGTEDAAQATPREVYREALMASAAALIVFHNHPSGDPSPSAEDVIVTARLALAGETVGVEFIDHIILGTGRYYSFKARRRIK